LIREVTKEEARDALLSSHLPAIKSILGDEPSAIIGGSFALILQNVIEPRVVKDIDITVPYYTNFNGKADVDSVFPGGSGDDAYKVTYSANGFHEEFDMFIEPKAIYKIIEYGGIKMKVQKPEGILMAKAQYLFRRGRTKHAKDLLTVMQTIVEEDAMPSMFMTKPKKNSLSSLERK
jgi:hypothetical protein